MKMLNITLKSVVIFWALVHKSTIPMIQRQFSIIYFKKSSNTRAPPSREVLIVNVCALILLMRLGIVMLVVWEIGQMLIPEWAALALRILQWPTLICKTKPVWLQITPTQSSRNCIENL